LDHAWRERYRWRWWSRRYELMEERATCFFIVP
jgi:hypothetical protein